MVLKQQAEREKKPFDPDKYFEEHPDVDQWRRDHPEEYKKEMEEIAREKKEHPERYKNSDSRNAFPMPSSPSTTDGNGPTRDDARSDSARGTSTTDRDAAILRTKDEHDVPLATTEKDYDRVGTLAAAHDDDGIAQMLADGRAWAVPSGTKCRVIDRGMFTSEVRILEGSHKGQSGFVASDFLKDGR